MQALPEEAVERYRARLACSTSPLPLLTGRAAAEARWPAPPEAGWAAAGLPPHRVLVGCGAEDALVDGPAVEEVRLTCGSAADGLHRKRCPMRWAALALATLTLACLPPALLSPLAPSTHALSLQAAAFFGVQPTIWQPGVGHDVMLDAGWRQVADGLLAWLDRRAAAEGGSRFDSAHLTAAGSAEP